MAKECMLTTIDNPFNPFEQIMPWRQFDMEKGYYTSEYLARFVNFTDGMTQQEENEEVERAIDEILEHDPRPIFLKVTRDSYN